MSHLPISIHKEETNIYAPEADREKTHQVTKTMSLLAAGGGQRWGVKGPSLGGRLNLGLLLEHEYIRNSGLQRAAVASETRTYMKTNL